MAKDAFALSPISARAVQPSEEDYDAISEAFMETARGRWFLGEYAKRNRNADTRMVLDAVARIEQSLAAQKQQHADDRFAGALTAIKAAIDEARTAASAAIDGLALEQNLAPVRKGARIMKEISWRWREIGADGRICDLIDSQVAAIEASCAQFESVDPQMALNAAFDLIDRRLAQFGEQDDAPVEAGTVEQAVAGAASPLPPSPPVSDHVTSPAAQQGESAASNAVAEARIKIEAAAVTPAEATSESDAPTAETEETPAAQVAAPEIVEPVADAATETASENMETSTEAADAHDEAVLDMIAMEMAVVDPMDEEEESRPVETAAQPADTPAPTPGMVTLEPAPSAIAEMSSPATKMESAVETTPAVAIEKPAPVMQKTISPAMEPSPAPPPLQPVMEVAGAPSSVAQMEPSPESLAQAILEASLEPSLGSAIVASGIIRRPISASDPLASLRRLTQAEKLALFS